MVTLPLVDSPGDGSVVNFLRYSMYLSTLYNGGLGLLKSKKIYHLEQES